MKYDKNNVHLFITTDVRYKEIVLVLANVEFS